MMASRTGNPNSSPNPGRRPDRRPSQRPGQPGQQSDRRPGEPQPRGIPDGAIIGLLATLLGTTALVWTSTALGALATHGHLPHPLPFEGTATAIRELALHPNSLSAAWPGTPAGALPSPTAFWWTFFVLLVLLIALTLTILTGWTRLRRARNAAAEPEPAPSFAKESKAERDPRPEPEPKPAPNPNLSRPAGHTPSSGFADFADFVEDPDPIPTPRSPHAPTPPAAPATRPETASPAGPAAPAAPGPFAFPSGAVCLLTPDPPAASAAKRQLLQRTVDAATGAVLVVTDDLRLWETRPAHRDARLFDPLQLTDTDSETRVRWAPHSHCEDPATALARAGALLAPTARAGRAPGEQGIQETAQNLLRCWLHAAALDQRPFRHVLRWAGSTAARQEAVTILRTADPHAAAPGWSGELQAALANGTDLRDAALDRVLSALDVLSDLHVLKACTPESTIDGLDVESFLRRRGTLYLIGRADETRVSRAAHSAMPLLTALVEDVVEHGRRMAVRSSSGRLDPPALCILDGVAAVAPFPGLPELMARGGPLGLNTVAVLRSPEQARARWGDRAIHSLWTNADARAVLGPANGAAPPEAPAAADLAADELLLLHGRHPAERVLLPPPMASGESTATNIRLLP